MVRLNLAPLGRLADEVCDVFAVVNLEGFQIRSLEGHTVLDISVPSNCTADSVKRLVAEG